MNKIKYFQVLISILLIVSFSQGIFELCGIPLWVPKLIEESIALMVFLLAFLFRISHGKTFNVYGLISISGLLIVGIISGIINNIYHIAILLFFRGILVYYLFFLGVLNLEMTSDSVRRILSLMVILFVIQIPASWIKYFIVGMDETWVGTVSYQGGELGLLVALFAGAFLISAFLYRKKLSYLIWIFLFFIFGIINEKRATVFVFPVLLLFMFIHYNALSKQYGLPSRLHSIFRLFSVRNVILLTAVFSITLYMGGRLLPDFNPENKVWGSFNIKHMYDYAVGYSFRDYYSYGVDFKENEYDVDYVNITNAQKGRFRLIYETSKWLFDQKWYVILFGMGGGSFSTSYITGNSLDIMFEKIGIRGGAPFMIYILLETGIIGFMFMTRFFYRLYKSIWKQYCLSNDLDDKIFRLGLLGVWFVFVFDSYVYSRATMLFGILTPIFYFMLAQCLKGQTISRKGICVINKNKVM
jgi:hypothetical protein